MATINTQAVFGTYVYVCIGCRLLIIYIWLKETLECIHVFCNLQNFPLEICAMCCKYCAHSIYRFTHLSAIFSCFLLRFKISVLVGCGGKEGGFYTFRQSFCTWAGKAGVGERERRGVKMHKLHCTSKAIKRLGRIMQIQDRSVRGN